MPIKSEIDMYLGRFRWGVPEPHVSDIARQCVQEFLNCWDEEVRENGLLDTPESISRGFRFLLEKFPEFKKSYLGLKIHIYCIMKLPKVADQNGESCISKLEKIAEAFG